MRKVLIISTIAVFCLMMYSVAFATDDGGCTGHSCYEETIDNSSSSNSSSSLVFNEGDEAEIPFALMPAGTVGSHNDVPDKATITSLSSPFQIGKVKIVTLPDNFLKGMEKIGGPYYYLQDGNLRYRVKSLAPITYEGDPRGLFTNQEYHDWVLKEAVEKAARTFHTSSKLFVGLKSWNTTDYKQKTIVGGSAGGDPGKITGGITVGPAVSSERSQLNVIGYVIEPLGDPIDLAVGSCVKDNVDRINALSKLIAACHKLSRYNGELRKEQAFNILRYLACLQREGFDPNKAAMRDQAFLQTGQAGRNFQAIGHGDTELHLLYAYLRHLRGNKPGFERSMKKAGKGNWTNQELDAWIQSELDKDPKPASWFAQFKVSTQSSSKEKETSLKNATMRSSVEARLQKLLNDD